MPSGLFVALTAGLLWGGMGALCAEPFFGDGAWTAVAVGPLIGFVVARVHDGVAPRGPATLVWLSAVTFTLAASAFGAAAQVFVELGYSSRNPFAGTSFAGGPGLENAIGHVIAAPFLSFVGVWLSGTFIVLWPLALVTHFVYDVASDAAPPDPGP